MKVTILIPFFTLMIMFLHGLTQAASAAESLESDDARRYRTFEKKH